MTQPKKVPLKVPLKPPEQRGVAAPGQALQAELRHKVYRERLSEPHTFEVDI